jgi:hypothetical protein
MATEDFFRLRKRTRTAAMTRRPPQKMPGAVQAQIPNASGRSSNEASIDLNAAEHKLGGWQAVEQAVTPDTAESMN